MEFQNRFDKKYMSGIRRVVDKQKKSWNSKTILTKKSLEFQHPSRCLWVKKSLEIQQKLEFQVVKSKKSGIPGVIMLKKKSGIPALSIGGKAGIPGGQE